MGWPTTVGIMTVLPFPERGRQKMPASPAIEDLGNAARIFAALPDNVAETTSNTALNAPDFQTYAAIARRLIADRVDREALLGPDIFQNISWTITLDLYVAMTDNRRHSDVAISLASGAPTTTAARVIAIMIDKGELIRTTDEGDGIRSLIALSPSRFVSVTAYLARVAERWGVVVYNPSAFAGS